jgi:hypothetical protein
MLLLDKCAIMGQSVERASVQFVVIAKPEPRAGPGARLSKYVLDFLLRKSQILQGLGLSVSTCLQALGATFDSNNRTWALVAAEVDRVDEEDFAAASEATAGATRSSTQFLQTAG